MWPAAVVGFGLGLTAAWVGVLAHGAADKRYFYPRRQPPVPPNYNSTWIEIR